MKMNGAKAIVECLKKEGVKTAFGYPGGAIMPFYDEIIRQTDVRHVLARHEQGAAHMAEGYARASGEVGVCVSTSGPGATNLITGLVDAYCDSVPIVALSGQVPTKLIGNDAFQEADMFGLTMPMVKHNYKVMKPSDIPMVFKNAFHIARTGRPGPVHIDLPKDTQTTEFDFDYPKAPSLAGYNPNLEGHPLQVKKAVEMLLDAQRPLVVLGGGVVIANASQEAAKLSEALFLPVATTLMAKGAFDERHPLALGMLGMHGRKSANYAVENCDLLLAVGTRFSDRVTGDLKTFAPQAKIIHVDLDASEIGKNTRADLPIVGDAKKILSAMLDTLAKMNRLGKTSKSEWAKKMEQLRRNCDCSLDFPGTPIKPQKAIFELQKALSDKSIVVTEVGQNQMFAAHYLRINGPRNFISSGGLGTMGFGLPAAVGAKAAKPSSTVFDVAGDGSLMMTCQELGTAVSADLPVVVFLLNNNWLGMVKQWQKLFMDKRYSNTHLGDYTDFVKLSEAFGGSGEKVTNPGDIAGALARAQKSKAAYVIDVRTDCEEDVLPMVPPGGTVSARAMIGNCPWKGCD
ncbi:MAG: biosynthetic-type acetolactate synthase large subunit [Candidatus Micrarchaeia archaeon]|jgi:acetolactate synthase-1/2/3 large subunit